MDGESACVCVCACVFKDIAFRDLSASVCMSAWQGARASAYMTACVFAPKRGALKMYTCYACMCVCARAPAYE